MAILELWCTFPGKKIHYLWRFCCNFYPVVQLTLFSWPYTFVTYEEPRVIINLVYKNDIFISGIDNKNRRCQAQVKVHIMFARSPNICPLQCKQKIRQTSFSNCVLVFKTLSYDVLPGSEIKIYIKNFWVTLWNVALMVKP